MIEEEVEIEEQKELDMLGITEYSNEEVAVLRKHWKQRKMEDKNDR